MTDQDQPEIGARIDANSTKTNTWRLVSFPVTEGLEQAWCS